MNKTVVTCNYYSAYRPYKLYGKSAAEFEVPCKFHLPFSLPLVVWYGGRQLQL